MKYHFLCHSKGFGISFLRGSILEESDFTHNFLDLLRNNTNGHKHSREVLWMQKSGFSVSVTLSTHGEQLREDERRSLLRRTQSSLNFPVFPSRLFLPGAIQEILSVWPSFYSSSANVFFCCFLCSTTKPICSAWLFRSFPNVGGLTLWVPSRGLREPRTYMDVSSIAVSLLFTRAHTKWIHRE